MEKLAQIAEYSMNQLANDQTVTTRNGWSS